MTTPNASEQAPQQTALVTGATGFIGGHLVRHLARLGWKVHALARQVSTDADIALAATWHSYDGDYESVSRAVASSKPDVVFHLASLFLSEHKPEHIDALVDANLRFGMYLLEAMHQHNVRRLINTGTSWQHYNNADYDPVNLYAGTKQAFEAIIDYYCNVHQFSAITLKLFDTYGPGDERGKLIEQLIKKALDQTELEMTDGNQILRLCHIQEVILNIANAGHGIKAPKKQTTEKSHLKIQVDNGIACTVRELKDRMEKILKQTINAKWGARIQPIRTYSAPNRSCTTPSDTNHLDDLFAKTIISLRDQIQSTFKKKQ
jgi:nucleoside-diphosphate-sugar epimerase